MPKYALPSSIDNRCCQLTLLPRTGCRNWYHVNCLQKPISHALPFMTNYNFQCAMCRDEEFFERITASWKDICWTAIANLILQEVVRENGPDRALYTSKNAHLMEQEWRPDRFFFNKKDHIIPFVDANWKSICTDRARTTTWWATLGSTLYTAKDMFITRDEHHRTAASDFCLVDANLWNVRPNVVQVCYSCLVLFPNHSFSTQCF